MSLQHDLAPTGTVTFLFTDIEDSTRLWQEQPEAMARAHALHDRILREAIETNHGHVFQVVGDSFGAAFHNAQDALTATLVAQRELQGRQDDSALRVRARMGFWTGLPRAGCSMISPESAARLTGKTWPSSSCAAGMPRSAS